MEHAVAEAAQDGRDGERPVRRGEAGQAHSPGEEGHPRGKHATGAQMVDEKSRHGLAHARGRVEQSHEEAQLRVGHAEVLAEERKEGRQHELEEVADEVGGADERNDAHVTSHTAANRLRCRANAPPPRYRLTPGRSRARSSRVAQWEAGCGGFSPRGTMPESRTPRVLPSRARTEGDRHAGCRPLRAKYAASGRGPRAAGTAGGR